VNTIEHFVNQCKGQPTSFVAIPIILLLFTTWAFLVWYNKYKREANERSRFSRRQSNGYYSPASAESLAQARVSKIAVEELQQSMSDDLNDHDIGQSLVDGVQRLDPIDDLYETLNQGEYLPPASEGDLSHYDVVQSSPLITHSEGAYHTRAYTRRAGTSHLQSPEINDSSPVSRGHFASPDIFTPSHVAYSTPLTTPTSPPNQGRLRSQSPISPSRQRKLYRIAIPCAISTIVDVVTSPIRSAASILSLGSPIIPPWKVVVDDNTHQSPVRRGKTPIPIRGFVRGTGGLCTECNRIHTYPLQGIDETLGCMSADEYAELLAIQEEDHLQRMERRSERIAAQRAARAQGAFL
jgi:hypothetical protein